MIYSTLAENAKAVPRTFTQTFTLIFLQEPSCSLPWSLKRSTERGPQQPADIKPTHLLLSPQPPSQLIPAFHVPSFLRCCTLFLSLISLSRHGAHPHNPSPPDHGPVLPFSMSPLLPVPAQILTTHISVHCREPLPSMGLQEHNR